MMICIETVLLVRPCNAVRYHVSRRHGSGLDSLHAEAARFETGTVATRHQVGIIAVFPCPAILDSHGRIVVNQVEAVVAISPCTTAIQPVTGLVAAVEMETEAVAVAAIATLRHRVVVVVGIAIEHEVVAALGGIYAYTHAIVHVDTLNHAVRTAKQADVDTLSVPGLGDLYAYNIKIAQVPVIALDIEAHDSCVGPDLRKVDDHILARVAAQCYR